MRDLLCWLVLLYQLAIIARIILSWFPVAFGDFLVRITEPVLGPVRRVLPSTGFLDLSPLIVLLVLDIVVRRLVLGCTV
jgi:YggT family protein